MLLCSRQVFVVWKFQDMFGLHGDGFINPIFINGGCFMNEINWMKVFGTLYFTLNSSYVLKSLVPVAFKTDKANVINKILRSWSWCSAWLSLSIDFIWLIFLGGGKVTPIFFILFILVWLVFSCTQKIIFLTCLEVP